MTDRGKLRSVMFGAMLIAATGQGDAADDSVELEPLWELRNAPSMLLIRVASNGCTHEQDFRLDLIEGREGAQQRVRIIRLKRDPCKKRELAGKLLKFEKKRLGLGSHAPFTIENPFALPPYVRDQ